MSIHMSDQDILAEYRQAKNPKSHIQVLADLNACGRDEMLLKLHELGCLSDAEVPARLIGPRKASRPKVEPIDEIRAKELYDDGMDDLAISEALGVPITRVVRWRSRMHLTKWRQKKQKEREKMRKCRDSEVENAEIEAETPPTAQPVQIKPMTVRQLAALFAGAAKVYEDGTVTISGNGPLVTGAVLDIHYDAEHGGVEAAGLVIRLETEG